MRSSCAQASDRGLLVIRQTISCPQSRRLRAMSSRKSSSPWRMQLRLRIVVESASSRLPCARSNMPCCCDSAVSNQALVRKGRADLLIVEHAAFAQEGHDFVDDGIDVAIARKILIEMGGGNDALDLGRAEPDGREDLLVELLLQRQIQIVAQEVRQ